MAMWPGPQAPSSILRVTCCLRTQPTAARGQLGARRLGFCAALVPPGALASPPPDTRRPQRPSSIGLQEPLRCDELRTRLILWGSEPQGPISLAVRLCFTLLLRVQSPAVLTCDLSFQMRAPRAKAFAPQTAVCAPQPCSVTHYRSLRSSLLTCPFLLFEERVAWAEAQEGRRVKPALC